MASDGRGTWRVAIVGVACATALLGAVVPAAAARARPHPVSAVINAANDHAMGAAIRIHEGIERVVRPLLRSLTRPLVPGEKEPAATRMPGLDVSHYQGDIDWRAVASDGARFAYIKATEGTTFQDPRFDTNYTGAYRAGLIRGAYHYGRPDVSGGAAQAHFFAAHGGAWSPDGRTLPGVLDIEYGSPAEGGTCYGLGHRAMAGWIAAFSRAYHADTGRYPVIYTSTNWWSRCVGAAADFSATNPLWVARYNDHVGALPHGWRHYTIWQFANAGRYPGDQDTFQGGYLRLKALAAAG